MDSEVQEQIPMQEELFLCSGVEAQVIKCGPWTNLFDEQGVNRPKVLILIIPGNPGFSPIYLPFMKALYCMMNNRVPIWVVSHAGFYSAPKDQKILTAPEESNAQDIKDICGLNGQIEHKIAFLRAHVPKDMKIILIAHSIGCYISLHIMKRVPEIPIIHAFLLFPTIERMAESPHGRIATPLLCWFRYVLYATSYLLLMPCPEIIKSFLTEQVMGKMGFQDKIPMKNCIQPYCFANAAYLGSQEMIQVVERDNEIIKEHLHKLTFYYGQKDSWCPVRFYEDMKKDFPEGNIQLCEKGIPHAFVIHCSQEMATIVANWINNILPKI